MKPLKYLLIATCLSFCAAAAHAQGNHAQPDNAGAQTAVSADAGARDDHSAASHKPTDKKDDCVGPASFCNVYFGN